MTRRRALPRPPADLKQSAAARWTAVIGDLAKRGAVDVDALRSYCQLWARWREAEDGIQKAGILTRTPAGRAVPSPLIAIANQTAGHVRAWEERLGIDAGLTLDDIVKGDAKDAITRRVLAQRFGVHMQTVTKWEQEGLPIAARGRKGRASLYREADVRAWLEAREAANSQAGASVDVARERARKERAQAIEAEQRVAIRSREFLPADEVHKAWAFEVQAVRSAITATYTTQADRVLRAATLEGLAGVEAALKEIAHELLRELSSEARTMPTRADGGRAA